MTRARSDGGLEERILMFLRGRGAPAGSALLVERFLKASAGSEEAATRLLAPTLEPAGMVYRPGEGWGAPVARADTGPRAWSTRQR